MKRLSLITLSLIVATPAGAQALAEPSVAAPVVNDAPDLATKALNNEIQAHNDAINALNKQNAADYAVKVAAFNKAQAEYQLAKEVNDGERVQAATNQSKFQRDYATWQVTTANVNAKNNRIALKQEVKVVAVTAPSKPRRPVCEMVEMTGSHLGRQKICQ